MMEYEEKLNEMANANVSRDEYPELIPNISDQISAKRDEIRGYKLGDNIRPQPKSAYLKLLEDLNAELSALESQNKEINDTNAANRKVVDDKYIADIETYKSDINNVWDAIRAVRDDLLTKCDWTQIPDSPKAQDQAWLDYRQALRDITTQSDPYNLVWPIEPTEVIE